ncbi:MAG: S4 domain-containing protein, partial [Candidatus Saccharimonadales bacterium]
MRINAFVALATGVSRREADNLIKQGKVRVNNQAAALGMQIEPDAIVSLNRER